jgi:hypothetical protein
MNFGIRPTCRPGAGRRIVAMAAVAGALLLSGCSDVVRSTADEVSVDTAPLGNIMPGSRHYLAWFAANQRCGAEDKSAELYDLQGSIVIYRCVKE